mmetsp:Transcript_48759/g.136421  ORF Transcript_48759/g.136421 Transcript_48759/m.136421 type:complete len:558 (+) Transcript_48759:113-1786(+)
MTETLPALSSEDGCAAARPVSQRAVAAAEVERGTASHQRGAFAEAGQHYTNALNALGVSCDGTADIGGVLKKLPEDEVLSDALHYYGALRVQQLQKATACKDDDEDESSMGGRDVPAVNDRSLSPEELADLQQSLFLLRSAATALPQGAASTKRGRILNTIGAACLMLTSSGLEDALDALRQSVRFVPDLWAPRANLVRALRRKGKDASPNEEAELEMEAASTLAEMARIRPTHPGIFYRFGMSLKAAGRTAEAIDALERHLEAAEEAVASSRETGAGECRAFASWKTAQTRHWLAVMRGDNTATAPPEYVASLFDFYAEKFEEHLVCKLQYNTPTLLAEELRRVLPPAASEWRRCADLGCGTGLMGPPLRRLGFKGRLEGVDLSEGMLLQARKKGGRGVGYDRLLCGDILDVFVPLPEEGQLPSEQGVGEEGAVSVEHATRDETRLALEPPEGSRFELVVAADVFVYIGDLGPVFKTVARWLAVGGIFAFSTETSESDVSGAYQLTDTGRYTHDLHYVRHLGEEEGLSLCGSRGVVLRMNGGKPVNGHVHILRRAG